ncbi:hypothetical protein ASPCAL14171 [Aspergillus calidoustus]|uniref:D-xylose 1-dehydrogenase (NADP(+), D-xylono-1,5-lactone-forming) n=1 Tax=Aspergillus calidoustus TaxID=454130 RepID=A0A0U5GJH4_ASPCI|nr:hypothetical protein ASPCAL14171 [Aspergillus calidoustus]
MASLFSFIARNWQIYSPTELPKSRDALKFGILGAANIAETVLIKPAKTHPGVIVQSVAARDKQRATEYAKLHSIPQVHDSYEAMLNDPAINAIYIPLPVSHHYEWTVKAISKRKHVLVEKPSVANATEAEALFNSPLLKSPNAPIVLESLHYIFQPAWRVFLTFVDKPNVERVVSVAKVPAYVVPKGSSQRQYETGGGSLLNIGMYPMSVLREVMGAEPEECTRCIVKRAPSPNEQIDESAEATFSFSNGRKGEIVSDISGRPLSFPSFNITVLHKEVEVPIDDSNATGGPKLAPGQKLHRIRRVTLSNFMMAAAWHRLDIQDEYIIRQAERVVKRWTKKESRKVYTFRDAGIDEPGEAHWSSFRYQLEQFVNRVNGKKGVDWVGGEYSLAQARMVDMAYEKCGLPVKRTSSFVQGS